MHDTALFGGSLFGKIYGTKGMKVLDVGGQDVNGSLRDPLSKLCELEYISMDIEEGKGVDVICKPGQPFPFPDGHFDLVVSTSCFEHDPCFWMTFREIGRVVKKDGFIYMNAPSQGMYHTYPGDNWRFYSDAGQALAYWSGKVLDGACYPVTVVETFHILPYNDQWVDFVCVWRRCDEKEEHITVTDAVRNYIGPLQASIHASNMKTVNIFTQ